jgi:hypothetical protein
MTDALAYTYAREFSILFCGLSFFLLRRLGWLRGTIVSFLLSGVLGFAALCIFGSRMELWNLSAAMYRSLTLAHGCAQICAGVLYLEQRRQAHDQERRARTEA